ncbi:hypothetical protein PG987_016666 [Apiospora arundinis]
MASANGDRNNNSGQGGQGGRYRGSRGRRSAGPKPDQQAKEAIKAKLDKDLENYFKGDKDTNQDLIY